MPTHHTEEERKRESLFRKRPPQDDDDNAQSAPAPEDRLREEFDTVLDSVIWDRDDKFDWFLSKLSSERERASGEEREKVYTMMEKAMTGKMRICKSDFMDIIDYLTNPKA